MSHALSPRKARRMAVTRQRGFTMIEALVTFAILAVGVLGIVTLLVTSKTSQFEAVQRARAVTLADGLLERVRENPGALANYVTGLSPMGGGSLGSEPSPNCADSACDPNEAAVHDLWAWEQELDGAAVTFTDADDNTTSTGGLRNPRGCVLFTPFNGRDRTGQITVLVQWDGLLESNDGVRPALEGEQACGGATAGCDPRRRQVLVSSFVMDGDEL